MPRKGPNRTNNSKQAFEAAPWYSKKQKTKKKQNKIAKNSRRKNRNA